MLEDLLLIDGVAPALALFLRVIDFDQINSCSSTLRTLTVDYTTWTNGPGCISESESADSLQFLGENSSSSETENYLHIENPYHSELLSFLFESSPN